MVTCAMSGKDRNDVGAGGAECGRRRSPPLADAGAWLGVIEGLGGGVGYSCCRGGGLEEVRVAALPCLVWVGRGKALSVSVSVVGGRFEICKRGAHAGGWLAPDAQAKKNSPKDRSEDRFRFFLCVVCVCARHCVYFGGVLG